MQDGLVDLVGRVLGLGQKRRVAGVEGGDVRVGGEGAGHGVLHFGGDGVVQRGVDVADVEAAVPGREPGLVGDHPERHGLELGDGAGHEGRVRDVVVEDVSRVDGAEESALLQ